MRRASSLIVVALLLAGCGGDSTEAAPGGDTTTQAGTESPPAETTDAGPEPAADAGEETSQDEPTQDVGAGEGSAEQAEGMLAQWFTLNCPTQVVALDSETTPWGMVSGPVTLPEEDVPSSGLRLYTYDELANVMTPVEMLRAGTPLCLLTDEEYSDSLRRPISARDANTGETAGFVAVQVPGGPLYATVRPPARLAITADLEAARRSYSTWWEVHPFAQLEEATQAPVEGSTNPCDYHGVECGG